LEIILVGILFHLEPHSLAHILQTSSWRLILANIQYLYEAHCKTATSRINCCGVWRLSMSNETMKSVCIALLQLFQGAAWYACRGICVCGWNHCTEEEGAAADESAAAAGREN
jgi:hypothetical protein